MSDPIIFMAVAIASAAIGVQQAIYHCADAEVGENRLWWRKAIFRAKQRVEYKEYFRDEQSNAVNSREGINVG